MHFMQDVVSIKGVAKYTPVTFVVPSKFPDVLPDTPSGVTGSKLTKITDGAVVFEGNAITKLTLHSSDFTFGTNDFTLSFLLQ